MMNAWVILVRDQEDKIRALKYHRENPAEGQSKNFWAKLGTVPADNPRHAFLTWWPRPEDQNTNDQLFIFEGELKAAAACSAGLSAIAPTAGAGFKWFPEECKRLRGRNVVIVFDDDPPKPDAKPGTKPAGHQFRDNGLEALDGIAASIRALTYQTTEEGI